MRPDRFLPEEGVMLDAHLPQPLGSSVVRKLEADRTFKLLVLDGRQDKETDGNIRKGSVKTTSGGLMPSSDGGNIFLGATLETTQEPKNTK